jgi:heme exporter protein CcmD
MIEWLSMGGYAYYVWMSYGALAIALVAEVIALASRRRRALEQLVEHAQEEAFEEQAA